MTSHTIAHSRGVAEPRQLRRHHARIVQADGVSAPLDVLYSWPETPADLNVTDRTPARAAQPGPAAQAVNSGSGRVPEQA